MRPAGSMTALYGAAALEECRRVEDRGPPLPIAERATKITFGEPDENHDAIGACSCRLRGGTLF
jgi:hypothetical protein